MITVKGQTEMDKYIVGHIIDPSVPNIEFKNITFDCKTIKDASGHIFVRQKERTMSNKSICQALAEAQIRLKEHNIDLSNYSYKMTEETFKKVIEECCELTVFTPPEVHELERGKAKIYGIPVEIVDDPIELSERRELDDKNTAEDKEL